MKPSRRTVALALSAIAVFGIGFAAGAYIFFFNPLSRSAFVLKYYGTLGQLDTYLYLQCQLGTTSSCESALQQYIAKLEAVRTQDGARGQDTQSMVVFAKTRLALIAEQKGNSAEAEKLFASAVADCPAAFRHPCSIERLRNVVAASENWVPAPASPSHGAQPIIPPDLSRQAAPGR